MLVILRHDSYPPIVYSKSSCLGSCDVLNVT